MDKTPSPLSTFNAQGINGDTAGAFPFATLCSAREPRAIFCGGGRCKLASEMVGIVPVSTKGIGGGPRAAHGRVMSALFRGVMFRLLMIVLMMTLSWEVGFAEEDRRSANSVMEGCRLFANDQPSTGSITEGICSGLISGLAYSDRMICIPPEVTNPQRARVVVQYIDQRPARTHENFLKLASEALRLTWPCKAQQ